MAGLSRDHTTISTPTAIIGIRGSEVKLFVELNGITHLNNAEGTPVTVADENGFNKTLLDLPGASSVVDQAGFPTKPRG